MLFSQREGMKPVRKALQTEGMDQELRNCLWSALNKCYFDKFRARGFPNPVSNSNLAGLFGAYWIRLFKWPIDDMPYDFFDALSRLRSHFFGCEWNEVYDFVEFTLKNGPQAWQPDFRLLCNCVLEQENSGYRFVGDELTRITAENEINEIEGALSSPLEGVRQHLSKALSLMSERKKPDYPNSIKESISAVESMCRIISGDPRASLGEALAHVESKVKMHRALKKAFDCIYGYTSDENGIRHAMTDEPNVGFTEAKFMLVACSAFVNYLTGKAAEMGLELKLPDT